MIWRDLTTPSSFARDWYGWATNQIRCNMEKITLPAGAWAAISNLLRQSNLGMTTDQAAELAGVLRGAKVEAVEPDKATKPE